MNRSVDPQTASVASMAPRDIHAILEALPHRYPFLMVDRVLSVEAGKSIVAIKNVTINEPFFVGHFPRRPVMPGVLMIEALAQAAALLIFETLTHKADENIVYYLVGVDNARFKRPVVPGDQLRLEVELARNMRDLWKFQCRVRVENALASECELLCTFRKVDAKT